MKKRNIYIRTWEELSCEKNMIFLTGPRQAGKTTLARMISDSYENQLYFNWDIPEDQIRLVQNPSFFESVKRRDSTALFPPVKVYFLHYAVQKPDESGFIRIRNMATGQEREIDPHLPPFYLLRWTPKGKYFLVSIFESMYNRNFPQYIYRVDAHTGECVVLVKSDSTISLMV